MSFKNNTIIETRVLEVRELGGPGKRRWREILVEYPEISFGPGQFVMIRKDCGPTCWAYPYMLQRSTDRGFTVCAAENSSLYEAEAGTPLVVWGANGRAVQPGVDTVVLSQSATLFLAAPFLEAEPRCRQIVRTGIFWQAVRPYSRWNRWRRWRGSWNWPGPALWWLRSTSPSCWSLRLPGTGPKICPLTCLPPPRSAAGWEAARAATCTAGPSGWEYPCAAAVLICLMSGWTLRWTAAVFTHLNRQGERYG